MTTAEIVPCEGFFVEVARKKGGGYEVHIMHSCEKQGNRQLLALVGVIGCRETVSDRVGDVSSPNARWWAETIAKYQQYTEIENSPSLLEEAFDSYNEGEPATVAYYDDLIERRLQDGVYFIPDEKPRMRKGE